MVDSRQLFKDVSDLIKVFQYTKAINLLNEKLLIINENNKELKYQIILILGKLYLKIKNVEIIIKIIENELKSEHGTIPNSIKYNLMSILYRCYYLKSSNKSIKNNENNYKSKITTTHSPTLTNALDHKLTSNNTSDISISNKRKIEIKFKIPEIGEGKNEDLEIQYYLEGSGLFENKINFQIPIKQVSCGRYFSMALDSNGMVWNWGISFEVCSNTQNNPTFPHSLEKNIKSIAAGHHHCIALASDGSVYGWGSNNFGAICGLGCDGSYERVPRKIQFDNQDNGEDSIVKVSAGGFNSAFISKSGKLMVCGRNNRLQLGVSDSEVRSPLPAFSNLKENNSYVPSILVASSTITRDYSYFINNKLYSDLHVTFDDNNIAYCHLVLLTSCPGIEKMVRRLQGLKSESKDSIVVIQFKEFIKMVVQESDILDKNLLNNLMDSLTCSPLFTPFIDFISFVYTNITSKRYNKILREYSQLFGLLELNKYLDDNTFNIIQEESDLKIPIKLLSRFNQPFLSDCIIKSSTGLVEIKAHKVILSSRLDYFKKEFSDSDSDLITLPDFIKDSEVLPIIAYLYCDRIKFDLVTGVEVTGDYVLSLFITVNKLGLNRFKDGLMKLISQSVTKDNAVKLLKWSKAQEASALEKFIYCFISLHKEFYGTEYYDRSYLPIPFRQSSTREGQYWPLHILPEETFIDVSVGAKLILALTSGSKKLYQLGFGSDRTKKEIQEIHLPNPDQDSRIKKISCGMSHCIVVTENNSIYGWGCGDLNQLIEGSKRFAFEPTLIYKNEFNNANAGYYTSMYWNDILNFPLHPTNKDIDFTNNKSTIIDKPVIIEVYNHTESTSNSLWFFKNLDLIQELESPTSTCTSSTPFEKSIISTSTLLLPPYLLDLYQGGDNDGDKPIQLFGFSKETIEKSFSTNAYKLSIKSGDEALELLFLSTSFGNYKLSTGLFEIFKKSINLEQACLILNCIYNSNYSLQLSFLFNYLLGYIGVNRFQLFNNNQLLNSIPKSLLELIIN